MKRERFFAQVYFSNETVSQITVSTGPMKMVRLDHETMNVCQRNVARFVHVYCRFHKINDIFQGLGTLVSLFRNILCPKQMFPSLRAQVNVMSSNVSATMCPRLPPP